MRILVILGSLRAASFSRKLAKALIDRAPDGMSFEIVDGGDLPLYDQDIDGERKPEHVEGLIDQFIGTDGLIFVTPEYNYGIPGPLKNLIDWASRPAFRSPLKGKPALVIAHSLAPTGGARAHSQLTTVLGGTLTPVYLAPSFLVPAVHEKFDDADELQDEVTSKRLESTVAAYRDWAQGFGDQ